MFNFNLKSMWHPKFCDDFIEDDLFEEKYDNVLENSFVESPLTPSLLKSETLSKNSWLVPLSREGWIFFEIIWGLKQEKQQRPPICNTLAKKRCKLAQVSVNRSNNFSNFFPSHGTRLIKNLQSWNYIVRVEKCPLLNKCYAYKFYTCVP